VQKAVQPAQNNEQRALPLRVEDATLIRGGRTLLDRVTFAVTAEPEITVLLGANGAGKSLLIRVMAGLVVPDVGRVTWAGFPPARSRALGVGIVFHRPVLLRRSALANIEFALSLSGLERSERRAAAHASLQRAGLAHLSEQDAHSLSAGEQQRLALARAIVLAPQIIILDEPSANLDPASTAAIETQLLALRGAGTPVLFITHDLMQARRLANRIVFMHKGAIVEVRAAGDFFHEPASEQAARFIRGELLT